MDLSCLPALMYVTTTVLELGQRAQTGDAEAAGRLAATAELLSAPMLTVPRAGTVRAA